MNVQQMIAISMIMVLSFTLVACTTSQIITAIELAAEAAAAAAPIVVAAAGLPVAIIAWVSLANQGIDCAASATQASTNPASVGGAVLACLTGLGIAPLLPAGTAQNVVAVIQAIAADISAIIKQYTPAAAAKVKALPADSFRLSTMDKMHLHKIHKLTAKTHSLLKAY